MKGVAITMQDVYLWVEQTLATKYATCQSFTLEYQDRLDWLSLGTQLTGNCNLTTYSVVAAGVCQWIKTTLEQANKDHLFNSGPVPCRIKASHGMTFDIVEFTIYPHLAKKNTGQGQFWEYYQVITDGDCISMDKLNELGALRWNLISIIDRNGRNYIYYFKREKVS